MTERPSARLDCHLVLPGFYDPTPPPQAPVRGREGVGAHGGSKRRRQAARRSGAAATNAAGHIVRSGAGSPSCGILGGMAAEVQGLRDRAEFAGSTCAATRRSAGKSRAANVVAAGGRCGKDRARHTRECGRAVAKAGGHDAGGGKDSGIARMEQISTAFPGLPGSASRARPPTRAAEEPPSKQKAGRQEQCGRGAAGAHAPMAHTASRRRARARGASLGGGGEAVCARPAAAAGGAAMPH